MNTKFPDGFLDGFIDKCAEYGVDPRRLVKVADRANWETGYRSPAQQTDDLQNRMNWFGRQWNNLTGAASRFGKWTINNSPVARAGTWAGNTLTRPTPVKPGSNALTQNGKLVNPSDIAQRWNAAHGVGQKTPAQQATAAAAAPQAATPHVNQSATQNAAKPQVQQPQRPQYDPNSIKGRMAQLSPEQRKAIYAWGQQGNNRTMMEDLFRSGADGGANQNLRQFLDANPKFLTGTDDDRTAALSNWQASRSGTVANPGRTLNY